MNTPTWECKACHLQMPAVPWATHTKTPGCPRCGVLDPLDLTTIASYQVSAGDNRSLDVSPVDHDGMAYPPIADFDDHQDALTFCQMKNNQLPTDE